MEENTQFSGTAHCRAKRALLCVANRCAQDEQDLRTAAAQVATKSAGPKVNRNAAHQHAQPQSLSEPVLACLLGIPGSGKSTCIRLLRSFFEEAIGWEEEIDFQFLASQNTMAALIGGKTVHHWGAIPVSLTHAQEKANAKSKEGDVDALFERVLVADGSSLTNAGHYL